MAYRDNVSVLAEKLGISNDPGLGEDDITIKALTFFSTSQMPVVIEATDMNRAGRLFFQWKSDGCERLLIDRQLLSEAQEFFAELWEPNPEPSKRKLLDALRSSHHVRIERK